MSLQQFNRSKIVCTIGPASRGPNILRDMATSGMDVARINMSHGEIEEHRAVFEDLRMIKGISILIDLPGPKIRLGDLDGVYTLDEGDEIHFTTEQITGNKLEMSVNYPHLPREVNVGGHLYINDGIIDLEITAVDQDLRGFKGRVVSGGEISSRKGLNAPGARLTLRPPTERDIEGIRFGVEMDCDWFAASFIRSARDVENVRAEILRLGGDQPIISKIEHGDAIGNINEIIDTSDGVMVARGDLGIEIPPWDVPLLQKKIISACNKLGKPVIVATQMLESMVGNPRPTRAEASDVANALLDGADAVMLSGETAVGRYPLEAVRVMNNIGWVVQGQITQRERPPLKAMPVADVIGELAARSVDAVEPAAIIVVTRSGFSALMVSKYRPKTRILAVTREPRIGRRLHMYWGVEPLDVPWTESRDELIVRAVKRSLELAYVYDRDIVAVVSGSTLIDPGQTTTLDLLRVRDILDRWDRRD
jgi:pyruvate kinase